MIRDCGKLPWWDYVIHSHVNGEGTPDVKQSRFGPLANADLHRDLLGLVRVAEDVHPGVEDVPTFDQEGHELLTLVLQDEPGLRKVIQQDFMKAVWIKQLQ